MRLIRLAAIMTGLVAGALGPGPAGAGPADASSARSAIGQPHFRVVYRVRSGIPFLVDIAAPTRTDAWAVGTIRYRQNGHDNLLVLHWNGSHWRHVAVPHPAGFFPSSIAASSPANVWVFGSVGAKVSALRFDGRSWHATAPSGGAGEPAFDEGGYWTPTTPVVLNGPDVWAIANISPGLWHWSGGRWTFSSFTINGTCGAITGAGRHVWIMANLNPRTCAVGRAYRPAIYQRIHAAWKQIPSPEREVGFPSAIAASPRGGLWLLAVPGKAGVRVHLDHWTGTRWIRQVVPAQLVVGAALRFDGRGGMWAGNSAYWTGRRWINIDNCDPPLGVPCQDAVAPIQGTSSAWGTAHPATRNDRNEIVLFGRKP